MVDTNFTSVDSEEGYKVAGNAVLSATGLQVNGGLAVLGSTTTSTGAVAVEVTGMIHEITTTGADALTLAPGTEGQRLVVVMVVFGGNGVVTPTALAGGTTITFSGAGQTANLVFTNGSWFMIGGSAAIA